MKKIRNIDRAVNTEVPPQLAPDQSEIVKLVGKAADGDFIAFGELYGICLDRIYRYVFYQVRDKMMAEDVAEEVFIKAWKAIGSCKGKEKTFLPWLYRIAHNYLVDNFRSRKALLSKDIAEVPEESDLEKQAEDRLEQGELMEALSKLPQSQKQVIILKFIECLDNREISQMIGKSEGAIRVLQMRGLAGLRKTLTMWKQRDEYRTV